jgi:membrane protease YdiL (CAAX protease family)
LREELNETEESSLDTLFIWSCGFELAIGLLGLIVAWGAGFDARVYLDRIGELSWQSTGYEILLGAIAAAPMAIAIWLLMKVPHEAIESIKRLGDDPTMKALLSLGYLELFTLSLCAGVGEEVAFRGCLLPWLATIGGPDLPASADFKIGERLMTASPLVLGLAVTASSFAFGMLHPITKLYVAVATLMGVYFAGLMIATDSLLVPIVTHAVYNASQFAFAKRDLERQKKSTANVEAEQTNQGDEGYQGDEG